MSNFQFRAFVLGLASLAVVAGVPPASAHASHVIGVPNGPPVGVDDTFAVEENSSLNVAAPGLLANDSDPDGDPIELNGVVQPANGLVQSSVAGSFAYTPDPGFTGVDTFLYGIEDDNGNSTGLVIEVTITVSPTPEPTTTTTATEQAPTEGDIADPESADPVPPTDPATTDPEESGSPSDVDSSETTPAGPDEPAGGVGVAGAPSDPAVTTSTLPGALPATGTEPIALGLGALLVAAGLVVTALGTIATHGARRAARGHHVRHW